MGLIKEPLDIDFIVDSRPLTIEEKESISAFIRADKEKRRQINSRKETNLKKRKFLQSTDKLS